MRQTLILAKSTTEANRYARLFGLQPFTYRAVSRAGSIRNLRSAEVHVLPSFLRRVDRHAIVMALRQAKVDIFYVDPVDLVIERLDAGDELQQSWIAAGWVEQAQMRLMGGIPQRFIVGVDQDDLPQDWHPAEMDQVSNTLETQDAAITAAFDETDIEPFVNVLVEHVKDVNRGHTPEEMAAMHLSDEEIEAMEVRAMDAVAELPAEEQEEFVNTQRATMDADGFTVWPENDVAMLSNDDITEESSNDDIEPVDEDINSKKRRRKRCKVCEQLVWSDDDPAHDAEAHATTEALKATPDNFFG